MFLSRNFFENDTVAVAQKLLGCRLIRRHEKYEAEVILTETEAYKGVEDPASHAHRGVTPRNRIMFGTAGRIYVYFSYGMHYCMNIVTERDGVPGAVLLRSADPVRGLEWIASNRPGIRRSQWMNGPGKLTRALAIDLSYNGCDLAGSDSDSGSTGIVLLPPKGDAPSFEATPRIGISKGQDLAWRFVALT